MCSMLDICSECRRAWLTEEPSEQGPQWGTSYLSCEGQVDEYEAVRGARQEAGPVEGTQPWWSLDSINRSCHTPAPVGSFDCCPLLMLQQTSGLPPFCFLGLFLKYELKLPDHKKGSFIRSSVLTLESGWRNFCKMNQWPKSKTESAEFFSFLSLLPV